MQKSIKQIVINAANNISITKKSVILTRKDGTLRAYREYGQLSAMQLAFMEAVSK